MRKPLHVVSLTAIGIFLFVGLTSLVSSSYSKTSKKHFLEKKLAAITQTYQPVLQQIDYDLEKFVTLTPKQYKEITGKKLSLKQALELRQMQKVAKKSLDAVNADDEKMPKWAYILLVILGLGFIPIGIMSDWKGNDWWINLLLSLCFWIPGVIHGLIVMKKYY